MKCGKHNKDITGKCIWCGRDMCPKCITLTDGRKMYCGECAKSDVGKMVRQKQLNQIKQENAQEEQRKKSPFGF